MRLAIHIHFLSDWHVSSGLGDGHWADALLNRDVDGFPHIHGRAVKGAMREGARRLGLCRKDLAVAEEYFWGTRNNNVESNESGRIRVSSAHFPDSIRCALKQAEDKEDLIRDLTLLRQQTALDDNGIVVNHSLRSIECGMAGITLNAVLDVFESPESEVWNRAYFSAVCAAVRSIGAHRSRGLGRCNVYIAEASSVMALPPESNAFSVIGGTGA